MKVSYTTTHVCSAEIYSTWDVPKSQTKLRTSFYIQRTMIGIMTADINRNVAIHQGGQGMLVKKEIDISRHQILVIDSSIIIRIGTIKIRFPDPGHQDMN